MLFLGDIHRNWAALNNVLQKNKTETIIQLGDLGLGYATGYRLNINSGLWETVKNNDPKTLPANFKFIRGNHCNPTACKLYPNYLGDYGFDNSLGLFFLSGAYSLDKDSLTPNIDWWEDEELSYQELKRAVDLYLEIKPEIMISHTCPPSIGVLVTKREIYGSRTEKVLEQMWNAHKPKKWFFGHHHIKFSKNVLGTDFRCVDINEVCKLEE